MITALGRSPDETWKELLAGRSGIGPITDFDARGFRWQAAAQVRGFPPSGPASQPKWARIADLHTYLLLQCCGDALRAAGVGSSVDPEDIGLFVGMGTVDYKLPDLVPAVLASRGGDGSFDHAAFFVRGFERLYPLFALSMLNNVSACLAAIELGIKGENAVFAADATAGAQALGEALQTLREEKAKAVLAGGVSEKLTPMSLARSQLTEPGDSAESAGMAPGEGCAMVCLELRARADQRGARCAVALTGYGHAFGAAGDASSATAAIAAAMQAALDRAELRPDDVEVVLAHHDGTAADRSEAEAVRRVFGASSSRQTVCASKPFLGHLGPAAPAADLVLAAQALRHQTVAPALAVARDVARARPGSEERAQRYRSVLINARSSEGHASSLVVQSLDSLE